MGGVEDFDVKRANIRHHDVEAEIFERVHPEGSSIYERAKVSKSIAYIVQNCRAKDLCIDVGCGTGFVTGFELPHYRMVVAADISRKMLEVARKRLGRWESLNLVVCDAEFLPFKDGVADLVSVSSVLHHLPRPFSSLKEVSRVLKRTVLSMLPGSPAIRGLGVSSTFSTVSLCRKFCRLRGFCVLSVLWVEMLILTLVWMVWTMRRLMFIIQRASTRFSFHRLSLCLALRWFMRIHIIGFARARSNDRTLSIIKDCLWRVNFRTKIFTAKGGLGWQRQIVVENAEGDYILWVDADMILTNDYVKRHVDFMEKNPKVGIAKGLESLRNVKGVLPTLEVLSRLVEKMVNYQSSKNKYSKTLGTGGSIYRTKIIKDVGGFDKNL